MRWPRPRRSSRPNRARSEQQTQCRAARTPSDPAIKMATARTPIAGGGADGGGIELALDNWHDYKEQALHNLDQMKGHIAEAGKMRSEQKSAQLSRDTERELKLAKAWCAKIEQELQLAQSERDESQLAAETWRAQHRRLLHELYLEVNPSKHTHQRANLQRFFLKYLLHM